MKSQQTQGEIDKEKKQTPNLKSAANFKNEARRLERPEIWQQNLGVNVAETFPARLRGLEKISRRERWRKRHMTDSRDACDQLLRKHLRSASLLREYERTLTGYIKAWVINSANAAVSVQLRHGSSQYH